MKFSEFLANFAVAIWPVTGQGVENTKWPAVLYSQQISQNRKILANLNYHMSIKTSQAILKCFIDLKSSVWFTLGSEDETMFVTLRTFSSSTAGQGFQNTKWPAILYSQ